MYKSASVWFNMRSRGEWAKDRKRARARKRTSRFQNEKIYCTHDSCNSWFLIKNFRIKWFYGDNGECIECNVRPSSVGALPAQVHLIMSSVRSESICLLFFAWVCFVLHCCFLFAFFWINVIRCIYSFFESHQFNVCVLSMRIQSATKTSVQLKSTWESAVCVVWKARDKNMIIDKMFRFLFDRTTFHIMKSEMFTIGLVKKVLK